LREGLDTHDFCSLGNPSAARGMGSDVRRAPMVNAARLRSKSDSRRISLRFNELADQVPDPPVEQDARGECG
jgi:hypothetical protein